MPKEYVFEFFGTKEDLLSNLNQFRHNTDFLGGVYYHLDDYIVKIKDEKIYFGVARAGHSSGYWYIPTIVDLGDRIEFRGKIRLGAPEKDETLLEKIAGYIDAFLMWVLLLPFFLLFSIYRFIEWLVRKIFNRQKQKRKTEKEKIFDLMENYLGCIGR